METFDIVVLGAGPGGYVAAIRAAQLGFKTALVEKENLGGVCLNWGCIPTKALLKSVEVLENIKSANKFGITIESYKYDFEKIIQRSRVVSTTITKGVEFLMKKNKVQVIKGYGKIISKNQLEVVNNGEKSLVNFEKLIISTGARPRTFSTIPVDGEKIITSKEAMTLKSQPESMIIIGAGAIGVEFAYFYASLGTKVTIVELLDHILPQEDEEAAALLAKKLKSLGVEIITSVGVEKAEVIGDDVTVYLNNGQSIKAQKVLNAIGVTGNIENIGLENVGIKTIKGAIIVNKDNYQTNVDNIYAIGDVIGAPWLAHVASAEAIACIEKIKKIERPAINYDVIPGCVYTHPQIARVGITEKEAKAKGIEIKVGKFPYSASGKAMALGEREGFVKCIYDAKYGELLGATIVGPEATELIAEFTLAKSNELTYKEILHTIHSHPTLSEMIMEAVANAYNEAIHI
ncbi:MAG TPA: dihydrolipoyl dehydrogenase [Ignavibacteriales bacterium]|nr:dihydrolipoyl dehydrogenase [Ignavibacteriales bacterium]HPD67476.1 dihydrolipoyl dehydrogenase [Ignavibacteriales bacterium]